MSQQPTNQTIIQLQNNAVLIRPSEKVNEKHDEILDDLINLKTAQKLADIPARFESSSANLDPQTILFKDFNQFHEEKVSITESFRSQVIAFVEQAQQKGQSWKQSFQDAFSSNSIQNKLQNFKDHLSSQIVKLGNKIASLPEEIATKTLMKTALNKVKSARFLSSDDPQKSPSLTDNPETYKVGDYQIISSRQDRFSLLDNQGNFLMAFTAAPSLNNPSLSSKSSHFEASTILKDIKAQPVELNQKQTQKRNALITKVSQQMQDFPVGSSVGQDGYIVRAYQGEKYLDNGFGHQLTQSALSSQSYQDLTNLSRQFETTHKQALTDQTMPVFTKFLKARESYSVSEDGSTVEYNPTTQTMIFTSSQGETLKARSLGKGLWQHLEGHLSSQTLSQIKNDLEPKLDRYFQLQAQKQKTREVLQTLG